MENKEIYSDTLKKGKRTYFFDINKTEQGSLYLKVSESKKTNDGFEHHRIFVFEEDVDDFANAFNLAIMKLEDLQSTTKLKKKEYNVDVIRKTYPNAYQKWTEEEDKKLELLHNQAKGIKELAAIFQRNEGAIIARLKKLQIIE